MAHTYPPYSLPHTQWKLLGRAPALEVDGQSARHTHTNAANTHTLCDTQEKLLGRAPALLEVDERAALALLTAHPDALPPSNVVPSLQVWGWGLGGGRVQVPWGQRQVHTCWPRGT